MRKAISAMLLSPVSAAAIVCAVLFWCVWFAALGLEHDGTEWGGGV